jgi:hypothetical protein
MARKVKPTKEHLEILISHAKELFHLEEQRLENIEKKILGLQSQIPIFITIISVFYSSFYQVVKNYSNNIFEGILLIISILLSVYSLYLSMKIFDPRKFIYMNISPETIMEYKEKNIISFYEEILNDLNTSIINNREVNNQKIDIMIRSRKIFLYSIFLGVILIIKMVLDLVIFSLYDFWFSLCLSNWYIR